MRQQLRPPFNWPQLSHARLCPRLYPWDSSYALRFAGRSYNVRVCVFKNYVYVGRQRYTVIWPYTVCRRNTKTKISRTHTRTDFFFGMYQLETRFARIIVVPHILEYHVSTCVRIDPQNGFQITWYVYMRIPPYATNDNRYTHATPLYY